MAWQVWTLTKGGITLFISEHPSEPAARIAANKAIQDGGVEIPTATPEISFYIPFASANLHVLWVFDNPNPAPAQELELDRVSGLRFINP